MINKPLKVLQLGSPTGLYGAERWILALIKHLDPVKIETIVGAVRDSGDADVPLCAEAEKLGFSTVTIDAPGKLNFSAVRKLKTYLKEQKIDILHTHFYKTDLLGLLATRGTDCKLVSTPHGWSSGVDLKLRVYEQLDRIVFPFMDAVVPLSEDLYQPILARDRFYRWMRMSKKSNVTLIRNAVDLSEVENCTRVADELSEWKEQGCFVVGYIGQLIARKGLDILLKALHRLGKGIPWRAALVGEGEQREELEVLAGELGIQDRISFFGYRENRLEFLRGFDIFVLPSSLEGIPRCLMEAMAAKKLVIASDIPGCNDLIEHQLNGILFSQADVAKLAKVLMEIAQNPRNYEALTLQGLKDVQNNYSAASMAQKYEHLFRGLVI